MSAGPTLNSRLRVLVAKAFKAEKLYASIRNQTSVDSRSLANETAGGADGSDRNPAGAATLSVFANDVRAREWQRSHFQLRTALNEILSETAGAKTVQELLELRDRFGSKAAECTGLVERETGELLEVAKRKEFAHCLKLALDLVRHNARAQAYSVIVSELEVILDSAPNYAAAQSPDPSKTRPVHRAIDNQQQAERLKTQTKPAGAAQQPRTSDQETGAAATNVIPFSRRAVSGRRR